MHLTFFNIFGIFLVKKTQYIEFSQHAADLS